MATRAQIKLAAQARKKARAQRSQAEIQAIRAVRSGTRRSARPGGGQFGGLPPDLAALLAPMSQEDMTAQIGAMVSSQVGPEQAMLQAESARVAGQASGLSNQTSSLYQGLGQLMQPIAGNIEQTYQTAAESQSRFGQGFSAGLEMLANQQGGQDAAFLQQQGAPQEQISQTVQMGAGAPDVLNATGGYLPASTLNREGAAMTAYAQTLPAVAARAGQQEIAQINIAASQAQAEISSRMQALAAQLPGMRAEAAQKLWDQELQKAKMAWEIIESNRKYRLDVISVKLMAKQLDLKTEDQQFGQYLDVGINPFTGEQLPQEPPSGTGKLSPSGSKSAGIWVDVYGNAILDAGGNTIPYKSGGSGSGKQRATYMTNIGKGIDSAYKDLFSQINRGGSTTSGEPDLNAAPVPGGSAAGGAVKPTYEQAFKAIYSSLHSTYGTGPRKWRFKIKDAEVRRRINAYLRPRTGVPKKRKKKPKNPFLNPFLP